MIVVLNQLYTRTANSNQYLTFYVKSYRILFLICIFNLDYLLKWLFMLKVVLVDDNIESMNFLKESLLQLDKGIEILESFSDTSNPTCLQKK